MGNRLIKLPVVTSDTFDPPVNWGNLNNCFSGRVLFTFGYFSLVTGDTALIDSISNKWFFEEVINYSRINNDITLLPAIKKMAASARLDESIRQRASEMAELIEEKVAARRSEGITPTGNEDDRIYQAREILTGARFPQTTEILRLLRDKSPELKRLALFLIGKFQMTDMTPEVCNCLTNNKLKADSFSVLKSFGSKAGRDLLRFFLESSGNISTGKMILRLLGKVCHTETLSFLLDNLWSNSRYYKESALAGLVSCRFKPTDAERERLEKLDYDVFVTLAWILSLRVSLSQGADAFLINALGREYTRWKKYLSGLLSITYDDYLKSGVKEHDPKKIKQAAIIGEMTDIIFSELKESTVSGLYYLKSPGKTLKRLQHYLPSEVPEANKALEDIINCDYNLVSIWTKACALNNIKELWDGDIAESVIALLFSPEELLREEAARLIARSDRDLYSRASDRIPLSTREKLEKIMAGKTSDEELLYSKVSFMSSCFPDTPSDELLFLAEKVLLVSEHAADEISLKSSDYLVWSFSGNHSLIESKVKYGITPAEVVSVFMKGSCSYCYLLPLESAGELYFNFPENSYKILKYIDDIEE